jgi:hypothetical protein
MTLWEILVRKSEIVIVFEFFSTQEVKNKANKSVRSWLIAITPQRNFGKRWHRGLVLCGRNGS